MPSASEGVSSSNADREFFARFPGPVLIHRAVRNARGEVVGWALQDANLAARREPQLIDQSSQAALTDRELLDRRLAVIRTLLEGQPVAIEERVLSGDTYLSELVALGEDRFAEILRRDDSWTDRAAQALRESEERLQEALRASRTFAFEWNPATDMVTRSSNCDVIFGLEGNEATQDTSHSFFHRVHPDDRARLQDTVMALRPDASRYEMTYRIVKPNGQVTIVEEQGAASFNEAGVLTRLVGLTTDVTARERALQALRESEARLQVAKDAAAMGIHDFDVSTGALRWDERVRELFGLGPGDPVSYETFINGVHPDDRAYADAEVRKALDPAGDHTCYLEYRVPDRRSGADRWIAATGRAFFEGDRPVRLVGTVQDITTRKETEEALRASDRRKDEFLAVLSHELRNPLAPIRFALPLLRKEPLTDAGCRTVEIIERQVAHLTRLVDDLLEMSRIKNGKAEIRREVIEIREVLVAATEATSPAILLGKHRFSMELPEEAMWLHADPARLAQVVTNLLNNSARFTPAGGDIVVRARAEGDTVVIEVSDTGRGIPPEDLPRVFDPFTQLGPPDSGLGIGLALARQLVELHGGSIEARSAGLGQGAQFQLRLPRHAAPPAAATLPAPVAASPHHLRVLVVDDNPDLVDMLAAVVALEGHEVRTAQDGREALAIAGEYRPHLVLLDLGLPDTDGCDVARALRALPQLANTCLVALTGWGQDQDRRKTREAGFEHHLTKPADPAVISRLLAEVGTHAAG